MSTRLDIDGLSKAFGGIQAADDISFRTEPGQITGVIGPNGAGKTTLFNLVSGTTRPDAGRVRLNGVDIAGLPAARIARLGLVRTFQSPYAFPDRSVHENIYRAALFRQFPSPALLFSPFGSSSRRRQAARMADQALQRIGLEALADAEAGTLAYGQQKILGVGMALAAGPSMLLMDEPAAGLNAVETAAMTALIGRIHASGIAIVVVEHDMSLVMRLCRQLVVLVNGRILAQGPTDSVREDPLVIDAYLGADLDTA